MIRKLFKAAYRAQPVMMPNRMPGFIIQGRSLGVWYNITDRSGREVTFEGDTLPWDGEQLLRHLSSRPIEF